MLEYRECTIMSSLQFLTIAVPPSGKIKAPAVFTLY